MVDDWIGDDVKERGRCSVRVKKPAKSLNENSGLRVRIPDTLLLLLFYYYYYYYYASKQIYEKSSYTAISVQFKAV